MLLLILKIWPFFDYSILPFLGYDADCIPYSGKLSREKTFVDFAVLELFAKVFSVKFWGRGILGVGRQANVLKSLSCLCSSTSSLVIRRYQRLMVRFHRLYLRLVLQPQTRWWNKSSTNPTSQGRNRSVVRTSTSLPLPAGKVELVQRWHPNLLVHVVASNDHLNSVGCSCSSHQWPHPHTIGGTAHATSEQSAKVFSAKFYFPPIHESFLPWKFSAIR